MTKYKLIQLADATIVVSDEEIKTEELHIVEFSTKK